MGRGVRKFQGEGLLSNRRTESPAPPEFNHSLMLEGLESHARNDAPLIGDDRMREIYGRVEQLGGTHVPLLLLGETGTGKELLAHWAHRSSRLRGKPFVRVNCAGFCESLVESQLFGHERGAFTGAVQAHQGLFEAAHGGTLFLDEIAELTLQTQAKLLRVLECGEFQRLGSTEVRRVSIRFIAATHRDLADQVRQGLFRTDLFFRLNAATVHIPPLRERKAEILPLANLFLQRLQREHKTQAQELSPGACKAILEHSWPGNIRELRNVIDVAAALSASSRIEAEGLALAFPLGHSKGFASLEAAPSTALPAQAACPVLGEVPSRADLKTSLFACERFLIRRAIQEAHGNQTEAAKLLGISRRALTDKLGLHGFDRPRKRTVGP